MEPSLPLSLSIFIILFVGLIGSGKRERPELAMGGHGGLNILPQKRWNVYNFDNREKVRKDEEAAAGEEQIKREESRRREFEFRLQTLRRARNPQNPNNPDPEPSSSDHITNPNPSSSDHINLFENLSDFSSLGSGGKNEEKGKFGSSDGGGDEKRRKRNEKPAKAAAAVVITAEDEKYRLGYGLTGKGVKKPWYLTTRDEGFDGGSGGGDERERVSKREKKSSGGKKSIEELREERMRREKKEKERERALLRNSNEGEKGFSRRRM
ncbi:uncharacterized protein A4U43_C10F240 [Asparagus officinalis]|uniref:CBF1-interacting co-repressor CIR N-terminal domain-containing protein n=2 Tax=Asparagus officinalis TaxID=4686 RepID=A0A5P1E183_ASPOF|nr:uncharacterized protein A4U43_C10F240 [Asparagus officinalis]